MPHVSILNVGYRSTNYWVISAGRSRVLVDLADPRMVGPEDPDVVRTSWQQLRERGATEVYAGHGPVRRCRRSMRDRDRRRGVPTFEPGIPV
jgi:hypothetical protein